MEWVHSNDFIPFPSDPISSGEREMAVKDEPFAAQMSQAENNHFGRHSAGGVAAGIPGLGTSSTNSVKNEKLEAVRAKLLEARRLNGNSRGATPAENKMIASAARAVSQPHVDQDTSDAVAALIEQGRQDVLRSSPPNADESLANAARNDQVSERNKNASKDEVRSNISSSNNHGANGEHKFKHVQTHVDVDVIEDDKDIGNGEAQKLDQFTEDTQAGAEEHKPLRESTSHSAQLVRQNGGEPSLLRNYFSDLDEWLDMTGYHDVEYRKKRLDMIRERKQLEERLAAMKKAEEEEYRGPTFTSPTTAPTQSRPSTSSMAPPPAPRRHSSANDSSKTATTGTTLPSNVPAAPGERSGTKRPLSSHSESHNAQRPEKHQRVYQSTENNSRQYDPTFPGPRSQTPRYEDFHRHGHSSLKWVRPSSEAPTSRKSHNEGSMANQWKRYGDNREDESIEPKKRPYYFSTGNQFHGTRAHLHDRYFLLKSWNYDNVTASQADGLWATQTHNTPILAEAFGQCSSSRPPSHVILIFSVNKSAAFQGYAIMTSPPGTAPVPKWTQKLHWTSGEPFYVDWKVKGSVSFRECGHIKNPLNKDGVDLSVVVGRDGQEIEPSAGHELIAIMEKVGKRL